MTDVSNEMCSRIFIISALYLYYHRQGSATPDKIAFGQTLTSYSVDLLKTQIRNSLLAIKLKILAIICLRTINLYIDIIPIR